MYNELLEFMKRGRRRTYSQEQSYQSWPKHTDDERERGESRLTTNTPKPKATARVSCGSSFVWNCSFRGRFEGQLEVCTLVLKGTFFKINHT